MNTDARELEANAGSDVAPEVGAPPIAGYSLVAMLAFALSVMSLLICLGASVVGAFVTPAALVVILGLPLLGFAAALLGGAALSSIRRSGGATGGRRLAIFAVFVGIGSGVIQASFAVSAIASFWSIKTVLAPSVEPLMAKGVNDGDTEPMRLAFSRAADFRVDDARLASFFGTLEDELGEFESAGVGLDIFFDLRERMAGAAGSTVSPPANQPKPLGLTFKKRRVTAYFFLDQDALQNGDVVIDDALVFLGDGRAVLLALSGDAERLALYLGAPVVDLTAP